MKKNEEEGRRRKKEDEETSDLRSNKHICDFSVTYM